MRRRREQSPVDDTSSAWRLRQKSRGLSAPAADRRLTCIHDSDRRDAVLALSSFLAENHCVLPAPRDPSSSQRLQVLANLPQRRPQTRQFRHTTADAQRRWWLCRHSCAHGYTTQGPGGVDGASPWPRHGGFARRSPGSRGEFTPGAALGPRVGELKARDN